MSKANKSRLVISGITRKGVKGFKLTIKDELGRTAIDHVRIIIKDRKSEMDNMVADSALVDQNNLRAPMPESKIDLAAGDEETFKNLTVFVFNDRGDRIYSGPWAEGSFKTVFSHAGFYIYHIIQGGQRIDVGKMIITQ